MPNITINMLKVKNKDTQTTSADTDAGLIPSVNCRAICMLSL